VGLISLTTYYQQIENLLDVMSNNDWDLDFDTKALIKGALFAEMGKYGNRRITPVPLCEFFKRNRVLTNFIF
jgi:hypothetical protein